MEERLKKRYRKVHSEGVTNYYAKKNCKCCYSKGIITTTFPQLKRIKDGKWINQMQTRCDCVIEEKVKILQEV